MAAGSISALEFLNQAKQFINTSQKNRDTWQLVISPHDKNDVYICQRVTKNVAQQSAEPVSCLPQDVQEMGENITDDDKSCLDTAPVLSETISYEYHIVYSCSYAVPVLYFTVSNSKGKLLSLDDVWSMVPDYYQQRLQDERWTFLTQQEHPILGRPFFQLHPCHTADLMKQVNSKLPQQNYLITWLSTVGPVVGLTLPLYYGVECT
ncbi:ubiquitin-like-conjugating enzyme ATG10 [Gigantopelta aegis]|uniref:ubiquitin-like-conjugating enzyme ATG10 n=1 Tax=Gigantopelta aegis TaxID=1735272 RepID=UPI001B88CA8C|nr:ubiquitin-like-conjugating enzyme ATG10 [Gigantopelta aegis]